MKRLLSWLTLTMGCMTSHAPVTLDNYNVDFGAVPSGTTVTQTLTFTNVSADSVEIAFGHPGATEAADDAGLDSFGPGAWVTGLPATIAPGADAGCTVHWTPSGEALDSQLYVAYGSTPYDQFIIEVLGSIQGATAQCSPAGEEESASGVAGGDGYFLGYSQNGWSCGASDPGDAGLGVACTKDTDCPAFCCVCPRDCSSVASGACVNGSCAPQLVACEMGVALDPASPCPDGGAYQSALAGPFTARSSQAAIDSFGDLTVDLVDQPNEGCGFAVDAGSHFTVVLVPQPGEALAPGLEPTLDRGGDATVHAVLPDGGKVYFSGYVYLASLTQGEATGSFDVDEVSGGPSEASGIFDAPICP